MSRKRTVLLILAAVALVTLSVLWHLLSRLEMEEVKERLQARLSSELGMEVQLRGAAELDLLPRLRVSFADVVIRDEKAEHFTAKKVKAGIALLPLLRKRVQLSTLALEEPVITLRQDRSGAFNLARALERRKEVPRPLPESVSVEGGTLRYVNEVTGLRGIALKLEELRRGEEGKLSFSGHLRADRLRINRVEMQELRATVAAEGGVVRAEPFQGTLYGAEAKGMLQVDLNGAHPPWRADLSAEKLSLAKLFQDLAGEAFFEGAVDVQAKLYGEGPGGIVRNLNGTVRIAGTDIIQHGFDLDGLIKEYRRSRNVGLVDIGAYAFAGPLGALFTTGYDMAGMYRQLNEEKSQPIEKIVFNWKLENGVARAEDVAFRTNENRVAFKGAIDLPTRRYDKIRLGLLDKKGCAALTEEITGPLSDPAVKKTGVVQYLAGPLLGVLKKTMTIIDPEECKPFYQGKVEHPKKAAEDPFLPLR